ncbi:MAG: preprotein translocase subunit SecE [Alphaproteobacteria bacterium]|nr:preprotein translocase subunit SecE [Alphaproteobacteria bacterium]
MKVLNPVAFLRQVRQEVSRVVWPQRPEILKVAVAVAVISALGAFMLFLMDTVLMFAVNLIMKFGG